MKRIISLALAAAMALSLTACGGGERFNAEELTEAQAYTLAAMDSFELKKGLTFQRADVLLTSDLKADLAGEVDLEAWDVSDVTAMVVAWVGDAPEEDSQETTSSDENTSDTADTDEEAGEDAQPLVFLLNSEKDVVYSDTGSAEGGVAVPDASPREGTGGSTDLQEVRRSLAKAELDAEDYLAAAQDPEALNALAKAAEEGLKEEDHYLYSQDFLALCDTAELQHYANHLRTCWALETRLALLEDCPPAEVNDTLDLLDSTIELLVQRVDTIQLQIDPQQEAVTAQETKAPADLLEQAKAIQKENPDWLYDQDYLALCLSDSALNQWDEAMRKLTGSQEHLKALDQALATQDLKDREVILEGDEMAQEHLTNYSAAVKAWVKAEMDLEAFETKNAADLEAYDTGVADIKEKVGADYQEDIDYLKLEIKYEDLLQDRSDLEAAVTQAKSAADSQRTAYEEKQAELEEANAERKAEQAKRAEQIALVDYAAGVTAQVSEYEAQPGQWGSLHPDYAAYQNENLNYYSPSYSSSSSYSGSSSGGGYSSTKPNTNANGDIKYDPNDELYSSHDYNNDGYMSDSEFQDALGDYMDDIMYGD